MHKLHEIAQETNQDWKNLARNQLLQGRTNIAESEDYKGAHLSDISLQEIEQNLSIEVNDETKQMKNAESIRDKGRAQVQKEAAKEGCQVVNGKILCKDLKKEIVENGHDSIEGKRLNDWSIKQEILGIK